MIKMIRLILFIICLMITACSEGDYRDLDEFIRNSGNGLQGKIEPLPEVKPYKHFTYQAFDINSPFVPRKNEQAQSINSGLQPDLKRHKEVLESFPLEGLKMVGSLQQNKAIFALIKSPDGSLHRVKTGNYLGQDFGKINWISESEIQLREIVQDGVNEWAERNSKLMLDAQE